MAISSSPPHKPLLRGWIHAWAALGAAGLTIALCWLSRDDMPRLLSMLVFGLSMVELYAVSAIYHIGRWHGTAYRVLRSLDHSNIFILIAGTYTPLCFNVLADGLRTTILTLIWVLALGGIVVSIATVTGRWQVSRKVNTSFYIVMGWISLLTLPVLWVTLPWQAISGLILGGILYTVGAIIYARKHPDPFPNVLGFHEVFHIFVVAGSVVFAAVIWIWVLPFPRM